MPNMRLHTERCYLTVYDEKLSASGEPQAVRAPLKTQKSGKFLTENQGFQLSVFPKMYGV